MIRALSWVHFKVNLDVNGVLNVYWKNQQILTNLQTSYFPSPGRLLMAARVGGNTANIDIDNVSIITQAAETALVGGVSGFPDGFQVQISDSGPSVVDTNKPVLLTLDGTNVTTTSVSKVGTLTVVTYHGYPVLLPIGSTNSITLSATDTRGTNITGMGSFVAPSYSVVSTSYAVTGVNPNNIGFKVRPYQTAAANTGPTFEFAEMQQAGLQGTNSANLGLVIDGSTIDANGFYTVTNVLNWADIDSTSAVPDGNFTSNNGYPDIEFPGMPPAGGDHADDEYYNSSEQVVTYFYFPNPGVYQMGVDSTAGFKVATGLDSTGQIDSQILGDFEGTTSDTLFYFAVAKAGYYPFRLLYYDGAQTANCEWFMVQNGVKYLINDPSPTNTTGVKAYFADPSLPPYPIPGAGQPVFFDFNIAGEYTNNFNPWNDTGGVNGGGYSFMESTNAGVGGSGGVSVFLPSTDMTATYKSSSWDFSTNGATLIVSVLVKANGITSGDKVQLGIMNSPTNGLNGNAGVAFESFRFLPQATNVWSLHEQYRTGGVTTETVINTVNITVGHWYKFVVSLTNTSSTCNAACAIYDYGTDGLTPGANVVTFTTLQTHPAQDITTNTVWPGLRAFQDGGISAWDNFLVYQSNSPPVITLRLTNSIAVAGSPASFGILADGPAPISYSWYTNGILCAGASSSVFTTPPINNTYSNVMVVAGNANGPVTNSAAIMVVMPGPPTLVITPATNVQTTAATIGGRIVSTGSGAPTVTLYYGPADGGTNSANWSNSIPLGVLTGSFSQTVTGLAMNTAYYFTASAMNSAGTAWAAPSQSFKTLTVALATLANLPATAIQANAATIGAQVLTTGGDTPAVTLYYGPADGGTNVVAWSNNVSLGLQDGAFVQTVGPLSSNTTYYYTARAINGAGTAWATPSLNFTTLVSNPVFTATAVLTYHNDNTRMGVNSNETILTLANVNTNSFGRLFTYAVDGFVYAEPLIMTNVSIPGKGTHNVVFVATEHNSVYAFDADNNAGANASPLWQTSFSGPGVTPVPYPDLGGTTDITPEIGITSTPVIDPVTGTIYAEVKTKEPGPAYVHRLHALDITTGLERTNFGSPVVITCTNYPGTGTGDNDGENPPHVLWDPLREHSRPALTLLNGVVYMSFASHGDITPYHGWLFAYNATNLAQQPSIFNSTPNGGLGGFWDGGGGPSVDAQGNIYFQTGNGDFNGGLTISPTGNYAMSLLKFTTTNGLAMVDYFAPNNAVALSGGDQDLGSAAPIILPDSAGSTAHPHLVVGGGKTPPIYLVDRDNMGRFNGVNGPNKIVQQFNGSSGGDRDTTPAFFNNTMYVFDANSRIGAFTITNALFNTTPVETPDGYDNKGGATACISANGASNAIMWATYNSGGQSPSTPCVLRAYNAANIAQELYASDQVASRDSAGDAVKFTTPTIANGKVYVGAQYSLTVYGLAANFVNTPVISPNGGVFTNSVKVSLSDATAGAVIYYTLDGSTPTTNSTLYAGPFVVTNSVLVTAGAFETEAVPSGTASASFINSSAIGNGAGLLGQYWANTTSSAFTNVGFNTPVTLTRVDSTINFNWDTTNPAPNIGPDTYVVRWTGSVEPQFNETYTFWTTTDDGVRLWVDGQLLVNEWVDQGPTTWSGSIALRAQQRYNIEMDYYQNGGGAVAQLAWSSPSIGAMTIIPQTQLYPVTNPPPSVSLTTPTNGAVLTAAASVTVGADAAAQFNEVAQVAFYGNGQLLGTVTNLPYALTATGLTAGSYALTAVASDTTGLSATSAPVNLTVVSGSGLPYGMSNYPAAPAFYNMPPVFTGPLPAQLSLTGVFANTPSMSPAATLLPYSPNVPLWSDGAAKVRYLSIPNSGAPYTPGSQISYAPTNTWLFPAGTVFVKTFELLTNQSDPNSIRRLETRLLVRDTNGAVYGVTYKWRADNSDADLLTASQTEPIAIATPGGIVTQMWYYPSPSDCLQCHTPAANYVLGVNARQLNGNFAYPNGVTDNQLRALNRAGLLYPAINESTIPAIEQLYSVTNSAATFVQRARSYLDANCAQCHQPGGTGPTFDARYDTPLANQNIINTPVIKGNLGYDNVNIVTPNDVWRSSLYDRIDTLNSTIQMPPLARNLIDTNAVQLMAEWINSLGGTPALAPPTLTPSGGSFMSSVSVTMQAPTTNAALYYTLDGSLPTTNSTLYTGPILLTNSVTINANAWESGYINSVVGVADFTVLPGIFFTSPLGFSNGMFEMSFAGTVGPSYVLQVSTDLTHWTPISTNTPTASPFVLTDPAPGNAPARFYRVLQQP